MRRRYMHGEEGKDEGEPPNYTGRDRKLHRLSTKRYLRDNDDHSLAQPHEEEALAVLADKVTTLRRGHTPE